MLINELAKQGCALTVIHPGGKEFNESALEKTFSEYSKIEFILIPFPRFKKIPGHYIRENKVYSKNIFEYLNTAIKHFDIIYCQGLTGYYFVLHKQLNQPVVINLHGYGEYFTPPSIKLRLQYAMLRPIMTKISLNADYVYSFGGRITDLLISLGIKRNRILEQINGIEKSYITENVSATNRDCIKFVYIGRNERRKGIDEIILAVKILNLKFSENSNFILLVKARS
ncbi:MAG: glycosyltransferase [Crocinitomicaceae bacterium]|nr:glycosyltransferase [Crocinitomicaceae bacterium]